MRELDRQVESQKKINAELAARNAALDAEVRDLKQGYEAIEERARSELGMIRNDEVFFQLPDTSSSERTAEGARGEVAGTGRYATNTRARRRSPRAMPRITSPDNPRLKQAIRLLASSRDRRKAGLCVLEGAHLVNAYIERQVRPRR